MSKNGTDELKKLHDFDEVDNGNVLLWLQEKNNELGVIYKKEIDKLKKNEKNLIYNEELETVRECFIALISLVIQEYVRNFIFSQKEPRKSGKKSKHYNLGISVNYIKPNLEPIRSGINKKFLEQNSSDPNNNSVKTIILAPEGDKINLPAKFAYGISLDHPYIGLQDIFYKFISDFKNTTYNDFSMMDYFQGEGVRFPIVQFHKILNNKLACTKYHLFENDYNPNNDIHPRLVIESLTEEIRTAKDLENKFNIEGKIQRHDLYFDYLQISVLKKKSNLITHLKDRYKRLKLGIKTINDDYIKKVEKWIEKKNKISQNQYSISLNNPYNEESRGSMVLLTDCENITGKEIFNIKSVSDYLLSAISEQDFRWYSEDKEKNLKKSKNELTESATHAAVAAVMSRNMSHNIGSHSLVRFGRKDFLESMSNGKLDQLITQFEQEKFKKKYEDDKADKKDIYLELHKIYNNNLRIRMDLIADIVTSVPSSENKRSLGDDVLSKFTSNLLFANTISGTDNFSYKIEFSPPEKGDMVSIPNDILGCDAFSIILENIIRNCAKHGENGDVTFKIELEDGVHLDEPLPEYYKIWIYEEGGKLQQDLVHDLNINLNKKILNDDNSDLRTGAWGMLEMKIAAAYLRKIPSANIDNKEYLLEINPEDGKWNGKEKDSNERTKNIPYIIKACTKRDHGLGYSFFLKKPKELLIIDCNGKMLEKSFEQISKLLNKGIEILHGDKVNSKKVYNHHYVLIIINFEKREDYLKERGSALPNNVIWFSDLDSLTQDSLYNLLKQDPEKFLEKIWDIYADEIIQRLKNNYNKSSIRYNNNYFFRIEDKNSFNAYFSDHSKYFIDYWFIKNEKGQFIERGESRQYQYIDIAHTYSKSKLPVIDLSIRNQETLSFAESIINRIGIVDERMQDFAINSDYSSEKFDGTKQNQAFVDLFKGMNIYFPPKKRKKVIHGSQISIPVENDINLLSRNFGDISSRINGEEVSIKNDLKKWIYDEGKNLDYLIIHLGILEKIFDTTEKDKLMEEFNKFKEGMLNTTKIIITSGRGKQHNLPDGERFLNYSQVAQYINDNQSKFLLSELCSSARKPLYQKI